MDEHLVQGGQALSVYLAPYLLAWSGRKRQDGGPYDPANITWLTEWALNGSVPSSGKDVGSSKNKVELIREYGYHVVPLPGVVWEAVRKEMGAPQDVRLAIENWVARRWGRK